VDKFWQSHLNTNRLLYSREALVRVGHRARPRQVGLRQFRDLKSCVRDEVINFAIEVASTGDALPKRCQAVLPNAYARIGARPCSTKMSCPSARKTRFISSSARRAFGMEHNVHVNTTVSTLESARGSGSSALFDRRRPRDHSAARHLLQLWRRVHTLDILNLSRIIRQIQTGA
jgi:hypothetical protein